MVSEDPLGVERLLRAAYFATIAHDGQRRRFAHEPYIAHPLRVSKECFRRIGDMALACAGVLHDTVEDTDTTLEDIQQRFGTKVADLVSGVTKRKDLPKAEREDEYLKRFRVSPLLVIELKLIDRLDNLSHGFDGSPQSFREKYSANTKTLIEAIPPNYRDDLRVVRILVNEIQSKIS